MSETPVKRRDHAEHGLSHWVAAFLDRTMLKPCWHTAIESGTWLPGATQQARMNAEAKRRARGILPFHLDWMAWQRASGVYAQWELKVEGRPLRRGQEQTMALLKREGIATAVCETVPEVCEFLLGAGFYLHGNARNVAAELHERYLGQRRENAPPRPERAARAPRKASGVSVARAHKMGLWR